MKAFFLDRGLSLATVLLVMLVISVSQASISYTMGFGALRSLLPGNILAIVTVLVALRFGLLALMIALWVLKRKRALFRVIVVVNTWFTLALVIRFRLRLLAATPHP